MTVVLRVSIRHDWPGLNGIVMLESTRETGAKTETETRFYITSLADPAEDRKSVV